MEGEVPEAEQKTEQTIRTETQGKEDNQILVTYPHEIGMLDQIRHQYHEDVIFRKILESPKEFKISR
jgi:hypothetical protein